MVLVTNFTLDLYSLFNKRCPSDAGGSSETCGRGMGVLGLNRRTEGNTGLHTPAKVSGENKQELKYLAEVNSLDLRQCFDGSIGQDRRDSQHGDGACLQARAD